MHSVPLILGQIINSYNVRNVAHIWIGIWTENDLRETK